MSEFLDSVWVNIFASLVALLLIIGNALLAGWLMGKTFEDRRTPLWFAGGVAVGVIGSLVLISFLTWVWADCPLVTCL